VRIDSETVERAEESWNEEFLRSGDGFDYVEALRRCVKALPERERKAVHMRYAENKGRPEMAGALKMTADGVKSLLRRIRLALASCVGKRLGLERNL
jgi:DNA-directed RNA polymerase specialized sigma24 family protein